MSNGVLLRQSPLETHVSGASNILPLRCSYSVKGRRFQNKNVLLQTDKKKHSPHIQAMALNSKPCTIVFPSLISDSE